MTDVVSVQATAAPREGPGPWTAFIAAPLLTLLGGAVGVIIYTAHMDAALSTHTTQITTIEGRMDRVETRVGGHDAVLAQVTARLDALSATIADNDRRASERAQNLLEGIRRVQDTLMQQALAQQGSPQPLYPAPRRR